MIESDVHNSADPPPKDIIIARNLKHPSTASAYRLVTAFFAYHAVKLQHREEMLQLIHAIAAIIGPRSAD